jgi:glycosyltransferase involved in cell wall biosynthesis
MSIREKTSILIGTSLGDSPIPQQFAALGRELADRGHYVSLLVHGVNSECDYVDPRIEILRWPSTRPTRLADALFFDRQLVQKAPCCLISNFGATNIMMVCGAFRRVPIRVHWYHTLLSQIDCDTPRSQRFRLWLLRHRARLVYRLVTHSVAISAAARLDLSTHFGVPEAKSTIFANAIMDPLPVLRSVFSPSPGFRTNFLCVGRLTRSKGQDVVLQAMAEVNRQTPGMSVEFVGDGPCRDSLQQLAEQLGLNSCCVFRGSISHQDVMEAMRRAWATVVPSRAEAFGLVNIESMAVGTPVIASATGGIKDIVRDGVDGLLFEPGNHKALAHCLIKLINNKDARSKMSVNSRQRFLEKFEIRKAAIRQADWLSDLISGVELSRVLKRG